MELIDLIEQYRATKEETVGYFGLSEADLKKNYTPGKWTVQEVLHHIVDAETVLYDRVRRGIANPDQVIWAFDQDKWCQKLQYQDYPLEIVRPIFESVREAVIFLANQYYEQFGKNTYVHSETGLRTVQEEFQKIAWHNQHHLDQIKRALQR